MIDQERSKSQQEQKKGLEMDETTTSKPNYQKEVSNVHQKS